jgi:hypothetical protein
MTVYKAMAKSETVTVWFINSTVDDVIFTVSVNSIFPVSINGVRTASINGVSTVSIDSMSTVFVDDTSAVLFGEISIVLIYYYIHSASMFVIICVMSCLISGISCSTSALSTKCGLLRLFIS